MEGSNGSNTAQSSSFLDPIKEALSSMQMGKTLSPASFKQRSVELLDSRFGQKDEIKYSAFAYGTVGIQADHSHYFNGFALLKPMRHGTSVSIRATDTGNVRIVSDGSSEETEFELTQGTVDIENTSARILHLLIDSLDDQSKSGFEIAIVTTVPLALESSYLASLGVASTRALDQFSESSENRNDQASKIKRVIDSVLKYPISIAYIVAAAAESPDHFTLVDTETLEYLPLEAGDSTGPCWALINTATAEQKTNRSSRKKWSEEIFSKLKNKQFSNLMSIRELEHHDLETATNMLPRKMRPGLRYLVSENRRVQRLVAAIRNEDWQLMGALLLMSHALRRNNWSITSPIQDFVVDQAERFSIEGVYGATQTDEGSFVLVAGKAVGLPAFLDHLRSSWPTQGTDGPETFII